MSKSKEYIESESFVVVNPNFPVIAKENAFKAVAMAQEEMVMQTVSLPSLRKN